MIPISSRPRAGEHHVRKREAAASPMPQAVATDPAQVPISSALIPARGEE
jgi:hypothetical protein